MYIIDVHKCPHCGCTMELQMFAVSSLLGPSKVNCLECRQPVRLQRLEWLNMPLPRRIWFVGVTLFYVFMVGLLTGNCIDEAFQRWNLNPEIVELRYQSPVFLVSACVGGISVVLLQIYRIIASRRRSRNGYTLTQADYILGLQWNLHFKVLLLLIAIWGVANIRYYLYFVGWAIGRKFGKYTRYFYYQLPT